MTPLYVTLIYDLISGRKIRIGYALSALLAVAGAAIIRYDHISEHFIIGLLLGTGGEYLFCHRAGGIQTSDGNPSINADLFLVLHPGALMCAAVVAWFLWGNPQKLPTTELQWGIWCG